jgi:GTP-binding protein
MNRIVETHQVSSARSLDRLPEESLPEVAFAGRSNVGKSSLLNALAGRRRLFEVSKVPGRTRTIIHAEARLDDGARIFLVDLPGYGYAKVSKEAKRAWARLVEGYLEQRATLQLLVLLVDPRRGLAQEEENLIAFLAQLGLPGMLAATKIDRLAKSKRHLELDKLKKQSGVPLIPTSAVTGQGIDELCRVVLARLNPGSGPT